MSLTSALSPRRILESQQASAYIWLVVAFGVGIATYFSLSFEPAAGPILLIFGLSGLLIGLLWRRREEKMVGFALASLIFFFIAGVGAAQLRTAIIHTPMITKETGPRMVEGTIEAIDILGEGGDVRLILRDVVIERVEPENTPRKIRVRLRQGGDVMPGQRVSGLAALNPPSPPVAPGAFDFQRMAYFQSIGAVGFFYRAPEIIGGDIGIGPMHMIEQWRMAIATHVQAQIPNATGGVIATLMTGQRQATREEDIEAMRDSGLAHLLAISGLHVGMIAASLFFFARLVMATVPSFALRHPIKKYAALIAFTGALFYTLIAGMTVPTQRALLMTGIALLAITLDRSPFSIRMVAFAAFVVMLATPDAMMGVSFQMSFAAVISLIVFYDWLRPYWSAVYSRAGWVRRVILYLVGVFFTSVIAGAATGLFSLYHFQTFALYNLIANMIAVPIMGVVVMPSALISMAMMPFGLDAWPLAAMAWGVSWILATAHWVAGIEGAVLRLAAFPPWVFAGIVVSMIFFMVWQGRARFAGLIGAVLLLLLIPLARAPDMLVNSDASLVAVKDGTGALMFSKGRGDTYAAETWLRRNGEPPDRKRAVWPREGQAGYLRCDALACRYERKGQRVSILRSPRVIGAECEWAGLVIASFPIREGECPHPYIIDRFSVWREGAHALSFHHAGIHLQAVERMRGTRPWTQTAAREKRD